MEGSIMSADAKGGGVELDVLGEGVGGGGVEEEREAHAAIRRDLPLPVGPRKATPDILLNGRDVDHR